MDPGPAPGALDVDALLAEGAWMRRLATALAGRDGDDLLQDTWLAVLARRPSAVDSPRAWLAGVMKNVAFMRARGETRRRDREEKAAAAFARPDAEPSTADLAARAELLQLAVRAVLDLAEPYRETLLLRYVRGLEPSEIARRAGEPASTVRSRIARGLEEVRRRLDARHGGERRSWAMLFLPAGGAIVSTKSVLLGGAAALVVAAVVGWRSWPPAESDSGAARMTAPAEPAGRAEPDDRRDSPPATSPAADVVPAPSAPVPRPLPSATTSALDLRVVWADGPEPAAAVPVRVLCLGASPHWRTHAAVTDEAGIARFDGLEPGRAHVSTLRGAEAAIDLAPGETTTHEIAMPPGVDVACRVVDGAGAGVAGAEVWLSSYGNRSDGAVIGATDATGRLLVRGVGESRSVAARAPGFAPSHQHEVVGHPGAGEPLDVVLVLEGPGGAIEGIVCDAAGRPIAGADVKLGRTDYRRFVPEEGRYAVGAPPVQVATDAAGRFEFGALAPGVVPVAIRARGFAPANDTATIAAGESLHREFALAVEARVAGIIRNPDGVPLAGIEVMSGGYADFDWVSATSRSDGSFELGGLGAGPREVRAIDTERGRATTTLDLVSGETALWDPVLAAGATVAGHVLDERGQPLAGWRVAAVERESVGAWLRDGPTGADGRFRLLNCPAQPFVLSVRSPEEPFGEPVVLFDAFERGDEDLVIRVRDADVPSAYLEATVVAADGAKLTRAQALCQTASSGLGRAASPDAAGRLRMGPFRPGEYELTVEADGMGSLRVAPLVLEPRATRDLGTLVFEAAGRVRVRFVLPAGAAPHGWFGAGLLLPSGLLESVRFEGLAGESGPLARGTYPLRTRCRDFRAPERAVEVVPGAVSEVEVALEPAGSRRIDCLLPEADASTFVRIEVRDGSGAVVFDLEQRRRPELDRVHAFADALAPGTYTVEAESESGLAATATFVVADLGAETETVSLVLE